MTILKPTKALDVQAKALLHATVRDYDEKYGCGSMSCAVYDTAWVSLVTKTINGSKTWLFPECFQYVLTSQSESGGWLTGQGAHIDGILNTAAGLLALKRHANDPHQTKNLGQDLEASIQRATASLRVQLEEWDVSMTDHVGFEIIVPAMLGLLEKEDPALSFTFRGKPQLMKINASKMSRFKPEWLYGPTRTTALHSLEAFIGQIDFDRVKHHVVQGSMLGSPSSTAAYLMHASTWDDEAEQYLRHVVKSAAGQGSGGIPSAFPSTYFEFTWILSTLLRVGFSPSDLHSTALTKMTEVLAEGLKEGNGAIGYAPYFEHDVDDTAKSIYSLNMLGQLVSADAMVDEFDTPSHFKTFAGERDPSLSANCNALLALVHQKDMLSYSTQIQKAAKFLCDHWWNADGSVKDKWSTCYLYPSMLLIQALIDLLVVVEQGKLPVVFGQDLLARISVTVFQACLRPLLDQEEDGSWSQSVEATAYGILILSEARRVCFFQSLSQQINAAINRGAAYIQSIDPRPLDYIWIEKVSYASPLLTEAYVLAAVKASETLATYSVGSSLFLKVASNTSILKQVKLFQQTPLFSSCAEWKLRASGIEAMLFRPLLESRRLDIFPRDGMAEDKYFSVIPFTWTSCNNRTGTLASTSFLHEMMVISFLNYQADEFMEAVAGPLFEGRLCELRQLINNLTEDEAGQTLADSNGSNGPKSNGHVPSGTDVDPHTASYKHVFKTLARFVAYVTKHPAVVASSAWDRKVLRQQLRTFLLAHVAQTEDSIRFAEQAEQKHKFCSPDKPFSTWVRTTSADHTSCPYSFAFVSCLLGSTLVPKGGGGGDCFPSAAEKYLAAASCGHLATMCRMYNDIGSVSRDRDEGNLNSVNFPEFHGAEADGVLDAEESKKELFGLAEYERGCLVAALRRLDEAGRSGGGAGGLDAEAGRLHGRRMQIWRMFTDVTDLYGQIYIVRDIASRMRV